MYQNVIALLSRSTCVHPLNLPVAEVIRPCLPSWWDIRDTAAQHEVHNLLMCVNIQPHIQFMLEPGSLFWMRDPKGGWPSPYHPSDSFELPHDHAHREELTDWFNSAYDHNAQIANAKIYLHRTLKKIKHPSYLKEYWPELVPYIGKIPPVLLRMKDKKPRSVMIDEELKEWIDTTLTACALLPDRSMNAWVGLYEERPS